jgi:hypothetical protein
VRRLIAFAAVCGCALTAVSVVTAAEFGANDDSALYAADGGESFYAAMAGVGLRQSVIGVRWQPGDPFTIPRQGDLDRILPIAQRFGIRIVFAVYPYPPREIQSGLATAQGFAEWVVRVATRYPQVRQFIVGNEPNQPAFWRPQFGADGRNASAASFGAYLAAAYDALKALDPSLTVVGVGLSPRGNDKPRARSNISTSPMRFLAALGSWYRASGRRRPLMDGFSFHPYPNKATDPLGVGYAWPGAGFVNLGRVKQALWDAFHDTAQPTTLEGLGLYLDEVGWQVDTSFHPGYVDAENVPVTDELTQAEVYAEIVRRARCDPDVAEVNVFGFHDDPDRRGFQAALYRVDGTPRPAADAVRAALQASAPCPEIAPWTPTAGVVGARAPQVVASADRIVVTPRVAEGAIVKACAYPRLVPPPVASRLPSGGAGAVSCATTLALPGRVTRLVLPRRPSLRRGGTVGVRFTAETNATRRAAFGTRFR